MYACVHTYIITYICTHGHADTCSCVCLSVRRSVSLSLALSLTSLLLGSITHPLKLQPISHHVHNLLSNLRRTSRQAVVSNIAGLLMGFESCRMLSRGSNLPDNTEFRPVTWVLQYALVCIHTHTRTHTPTHTHMYVYAYIYIHIQTFL